MELEDLSLLGCYAMSTGKWLQMFQRKSRQFDPEDESTANLQKAGMGTIIQHSVTARRPNLQQHCCENVMSCMPETSLMYTAVGL
jgi:hypothetical protein